MAHAVEFGWNDKTHTGAQNTGLTFFLFWISFIKKLLSLVVGSRLGFNHLMEVFTDAYNESFFENGSRGFNGTEQGGRHQYNYYAMLLTLLIFVIVFGNVLVCMAVSREKALQTTTNYLIVSLAVADLLVATLVMPWVVYLEVGISVIGC